VVVNVGAVLGPGGVPTKNDDAVCLDDRSDFFAGKLRSHRSVVLRRNAARTKHRAYKDVIAQ